MKSKIVPHSPERDGSAMILALIFVTVTLIILAGALGWATTSAKLTGRNIEYFRTEAAAEAATEKVLAQISSDYHDQGDWFVQGNVDTVYTQLVPTGTENPAWGNYEFSDVQGTVGRTYVKFIPPVAYKVLSGQFQGLSGWASNYRVISNVRQLNGPFNVTGAVLQEADVATIPLFQFAIFYNLELEINPGPAMTVTGPVFCNTNIYLQPGNVLTFQSDVRSAGYINLDKKPGDPLVRSGGTVVFDGRHDDRQSSLNLPIGTNSNPVAVREIVEVPPTTEATASPMGKERFFNKADMIISVNAAGGVVASSGLFNNFATTVPPKLVSNFVNTAVSFVDQRESKTMKITQIDIGQLRSWDPTNSLGTSNSGHTVQIVFIVDKRPQSGVRLVNGQTLLPNGLTIVTPNPVYIKGNYNVPTAALGTTNTTGTSPAAIIADAITVLSPNWSDANSGNAMSSRLASATTVNAAFLAGIVPTSTGKYSGGVENFPRFLEDWSPGGSQQLFTYNGSMVVMFESKFATTPWPGTGTVYDPPNRNWAFDQNFRDEKKLPPGTPAARAMSRGRWAMIKPRTSS